MNSLLKHAHISRAIAVMVLAALALVWGLAGMVRAEGLQVEVNGNREFADDQIREWCDTAGDIWQNPEACVRRIQSAYISQGYLLVNIGVERSAADSTIILNIREGDPARYRSITIEGGEVAGSEKIGELIGPGSVRAAGRADEAMPARKGGLVSVQAFQ